MITINYLIKLKLPTSHILTAEDKRELLAENKEANYSYLCLLKEMFEYKHTTIGDLLKGWGGVNLVKI